MAAAQAASSALGEGGEKRAAIIGVVRERLAAPPAPVLLGCVGGERGRAPSAATKARGVVSASGGEVRHHGGGTAGAPPPLPQEARGIADGAGVGHPASVVWLAPPQYGCSVVEGYPKGREVRPRRAEGGSGGASPGGTGLGGMYAVPAGGAGAPHTGVGA